MPDVEDALEKNTMLYWITRTCTEMRLEADLIQSEVAAVHRRDQSTIDRWEKSKAWPRDADRTVAAYAAALKVAQIQLWQEALRRWHQHLAGEALSPGGEAGESKPKPADDEGRDEDDLGPRREAG